MSASASRPCIWKGSLVLLCKTTWRPRTPSARLSILDMTRFPFDQRSAGALITIGYLSLHKLWADLGSGNLMFVKFRIAFALLVVVPAIYVLGLGTAARHVRDALVGRPSHYWRFLPLLMLTILCRWAIEWLRPFPVEPLTLPAFLDNCVIAPVNEELVFRGILFFSLLALFRSNTLAVLSSALVFTAAHYLSAVGQLLPLGLLGILLAVSVVQTRSLLLAMLLHATWNCAMFIPLPGITR